MTSQRDGATPDPGDPGSDSTVAQGHSGATPSPADALADTDVVELERDLAPGDEVGEYVIGARIGEGGFGTVFRAVHPVIGKEVAIKVLKRRYSTEREIVARFVAEARAVNQIGHRNIVDIFAFGRLPDGRQYYVMTLLRGVSLHEHLQAQAGRRLAPEAARPILAAVAEALDAAHAAGIAHRDLKPANVFLGDDGEVTLLDFGVAKLLAPGDGEQRTETGAPIGTPSYMSPEQARGQRVDHRTDVYSFGVLAYQVLTGRLPFEGGSVVDIALQHVQDAPPPPSARLPGLAAELDRAILWMLEKAPDGRPQSAGLAMRAIDTALGHDPDDGPVVAPPTARRRGALVPPEVASAGAGPGTPSGGRRARVAWIVAGGLALGGVVALGWRITRPPPAASAARPRAVPTPAVHDDLGGGDAGAATPVIPPEVPVTLVVATTPRDAELWLDGQRVEGRTFELPRDGARHTVEARAPGHVPMRMPVVAGGQQTVIALDLVLDPVAGAGDGLDVDVGVGVAEPPAPTAAPTRDRRSNARQPRGAAGTSAADVGATPATDAGVGAARKDPARGIRIDEL